MMQSLSEKRLQICKDCNSYGLCLANDFKIGHQTLNPVSWFYVEAIDLLNDKELHGTTKGLENISYKGNEAAKIIKNKRAKDMMGKNGK